MNILTVNLLFSTLVFGIATKLYLVPKLPDLEPSSIVLPILLLHALRHLGLMNPRIPRRASALFMRFSLIIWAHFRF